MAKKAITKLSELTPDANNYNKGTEFGGGLIEKSLRKLGAGRSILLDKNGKVIAGNKTLENAVNAGFGDDDLIVVQTTGKQNTMTIVGLSKLPRVLEMFARRFQNQERITTQVAEYLNEKLSPRGVAVTITARHLCMEMRGVKKHDTWTTTSKLIGVFKEDPNARKEFMDLSLRQ